MLTTIFTLGLFVASYRREKERINYLLTLSIDGWVKLYFEIGQPKKGLSLKWKKKNPNNQTL